MIFTVEKRLQPCNNNTNNFIYAIHRHPKFASIVVARPVNRGCLYLGSYSLCGARTQGALFITPNFPSPNFHPLPWNLCQSSYLLLVKLLHHYEVTSLIILTTLWCSKFISFRSHQGHYNCQYLKSFLTIWYSYHQFLNTTHCSKMKKLKFFRPISVSIR